MNSTIQKQCKKVLRSFPKHTQKLFMKLYTPARVQDYINSIPQNFEKNGETCCSPLSVVSNNTAHCIEGALLATYILGLHGIECTLVHLQAIRPDNDHVIAVYKKGIYFGALSKTNHGVLRYREPIYLSLRELVVSYFHEYFLPTGQKTLYAYSESMSPFSHGYSWITNVTDIWELDQALDAVKHYNILDKKMLRGCRKADVLEIEMGKLVQWKKPNHTILHTAE